MDDLFAPIAPDAYVAPLSVLENALYARLPLRSSSSARRVREVVLEMFAQAGLLRDLAELAGGGAVGSNGADLEPRMREQIALARAVIKQPDILIFENALHEHRPEERAQLLRATRRMLPDATLILLDEQPPEDVAFDATYMLQGDTLVSADALTPLDAALDCESDPSACADLTDRIRLLARSDAFGRLDRAQLRLLGFAAERVSAEAGAVLFAAGAAADGVYLLESGLAEMRAPDEDGEMLSERLVEPGQIVGELSVLRGEPRKADFVAVTPLRGLKIGAEEFHDVVRSDPEVMMRLLSSAAQRLERATMGLRAARRENDALRRMTALPGAATAAEAAEPRRRANGGAALPNIAAAPAR